MSISIARNEEIGILEVTYSPEAVTAQDLAEQRSLVADAMSQSNLRKVLIDACSLAGFPSIVTTLKHNQSVAAHQQLSKARFAVVCASLGKDERALENTGVNRGVQMKCFTSREEALCWLAE